MSVESEKLAAMRRAFDDSFAVAPPTAAADRDRLLALSMGRSGYAFRLAEIAGFVAARKVVSLASRVPGALGIAGIRGTLVPVYSLAALFGHDSADDARWFVLCNAPELLAFAFNRFEGYLEVAPADVNAVSGATQRRLAPSIVTGGGTPRLIIEVPALVETIRAHCLTSTLKEP